jgi:hypothetical protein
LIWRGKKATDNKKWVSTASSGGKENPPIAPASVIEITVTTIEKAAPPEKIYEIPAGLQKVTTRAELYAR